MHHKPQFFYSLESLRGVAAITVVLFHFLHNFAGYLAVDFFFVLSGFVLAHNYLYKDRMQPVRFVCQRIIRLYPLHIFTLFLFIACFYLYFKHLPSYIDGTKNTFIQQLTLMQNVGLSPHQLTWNYPSWSISTEFVIGIFFVLLIRKWWPNWLFGLLALLCFGTLFAYNDSLNAHRENIYYINEGLLRCLGGFLVGVLAYRGYRYIVAKQWTVITNKNVLLFTLMELISIVSIVSIIMMRPSKYHAIDYIAPILFYIMIVVFAFEKGLVSASLNKIKYLGEISYSIYLNHVPLFLIFAYLIEALGFVEQGAMRALYTAGYQYEEGFEYFDGNGFIQHKYIVLLTYMSTLIVMSHFTYKYIENTFRKSGQKLIKK